MEGRSKLERQAAPGSDGGTSRGITRHEASPSNRFCYQEVHQDNLVGLEHEVYFSIYWDILSSQLTSIFQRGRVQPPTSNSPTKIVIPEIAVSHPDGEGEDQCDGQTKQV